MPTRNVNLTDELDGFVLARVESGRYENASEVVRAALRTLEREEHQYEAKLAALRSAIDAGDGSGVAEGNPFDRVRKTFKLTGKPHAREASVRHRDSEQPRGRTSVARRDSEQPHRRKSVVRRDPQEPHRRKSVVRRDSEKPR